MNHNINDTQLIIMQWDKIEFNVKVYTQKKKKWSIIPNEFFVISSVIYLYIFILFIYIIMNKILHRDIITNVYK